MLRSSVCPSRSSRSSQSIYSPGEIINLRQKSNCGFGAALAPDAYSRIVRGLEYYNGNMTWRGNGRRAHGIFPSVPLYLLPASLRGHVYNTHVHTKSLLKICRRYTHVAPASETIERYIHRHTHTHTFTNWQGLRNSSTPVVNQRNRCCGRPLKNERPPDCCGCGGETKKQ